MSALTDKQEALVKSSWEELKQNIPQHRLRFFTLIVEIAPAAKDMFSFLKDSNEIPQNNPKLKEHVVKIFKMTCEAATQLGEKGQVVIVDTTLKHLGSVLVQKGVVDSQFEVYMLAYLVFRAYASYNALLRTIKEAMGDKWNEEMNGAWATAYEKVAAAIKKEMKQVAGQS